MAMTSVLSTYKVPPRIATILIAVLSEWMKKCGPIGLLLAVVGAIQFGFGTMLLFGFYFLKELANGDHLGRLQQL